MPKIRDGGAIPGENPPLVEFEESYTPYANFPLTASLNALPSTRLPVSFA